MKSPVFRAEASMNQNNIPNEHKEIAEKLRSLAMDFWWTGDPWANDIWRDLDPWLWERLNHNPLAVLAETNLNKAPEGWFERAAALVERWEDHNAKPYDPDSPKIAYFCMEFGLHESFPMYSGGLGVLAGDHIRSAGDLRLDFIGIGLLYKHGYFSQLIHAGRQVAVRPDQRTLPMPIRQVSHPDGQPILIQVPYGHAHIHARAWELKIGHARLFLLDTDLPQNNIEQRQVTSSLYGGEKRTRISQEILLGIGGARLLEKLNLKPDVHHMNEGHAAFLTLELWKRGIEKGLDHDEAWNQVAEKCVFTTHTPVPAGHDRFYWDLVNEYLGPYRNSLGLGKGAFMNLGRTDTNDIHTPLSMTVLALKGSRKANGVSKLHGVVSREMFKEMDGEIDHITNGVHPTAWLAPEMAELLTKHMPNLNQCWEKPGEWKRVKEIPSAELWETRKALRVRLIDVVRSKLGYDALDPNALTIGFARRFATYKRGDLIFSDPDRLEAILDQGAQLIFAGKAHPADEPGQSVLATVIRFGREDRFRGRVVFIPDYDAAIGRAMTQGCDVWLNNPKRPREASGTSGQKAALNGNLNLSILDGWWPEGFNGNNGWAIGDTRKWTDSEAQDKFDVESLYTLLEEKVIKDFSDPTIWTSKMASAIESCAPVFNTNRMVRDYLNKMYLNGK